MCGREATQKMPKSENAVPIQELQQLAHPTCDLPGPRRVGDWGWATGSSATADTMGRNTETPLRLPET